MTSPPSRSKQKVGSAPSSSDGYRAFACTWLIGCESRSRPTAAQAPPPPPVGAFVDIAKMKRHKCRQCTAHASFTSAMTE